MFCVFYRNGNHTGRCTLSIGARRWASSYFGTFKKIFAGGNKGLYFPKNWIFQIKELLFLFFQNRITVISTWQKRYLKLQFYWNECAHSLGKYQNVEKVLLKGYGIWFSFIFFLFKQNMKFIGAWKLIWIRILSARNFFHPMVPVVGNVIFHAIASRAACVCLRMTQFNMVWKC